MAKKSSKNTAKKKKKPRSRKAAAHKRVVKARAAKKAAKKKAPKKKAAPKRPVTKRANRAPRPSRSSPELSTAFVNASPSASLADHVFALASAGQINARVKKFLVNTWIPFDIQTTEFNLSDPVPDSFLNFQKLQNMLAQLADVLEPSNQAFATEMSNYAGPLLNDISANGKTIDFFIQRVSYYAHRASGLEG